MRRWLAFLMLSSLMSAQFSVLVCPIAHHTEPQSGTHVSAHAHHTASASAPTADSSPRPLGLSPGSEPLGASAGSPHGDDTTCTMVLSCTTPALIGPTLPPFVVLPASDAQATVPTYPHANPYPASLTPPPRLA